MAALGVILPALFLGLIGLASACKPTSRSTTTARHARPLDIGLLWELRHQNFSSAAYDGLVEDLPILFSPFDARNSYNLIGIGDLLRWNVAGSTQWAIDQTGSVSRIPRPQKINGGGSSGHEGALLKPLYDEVVDVELPKLGFRPPWRRAFRQRVQAFLHEHRATEELPLSKWDILAQAASRTIAEFDTNSTLDKVLSHPVTGPEANNFMGEEMVRLSVFATHRQPSAASVAQEFEAMKKAFVSEYEAYLKTEYLGRVFHFLTETIGMVLTYGIDVRDGEEVPMPLQGRLDATSWKHFHPSQPEARHDLATKVNAIEIFAAYRGETHRVGYIDEPWDSSKKGQLGMDGKDFLIAACDAFSSFTGTSAIAEVIEGRPTSRRAIEAFTAALISSAEGDGLAVPPDTYEIHNIHYPEALEEIERQFGSSAEYSGATLLYSIDGANDLIRTLLRQIKESGDPNFWRKLEEEKERRGAVRIALPIAAPYDEEQRRVSYHGSPRPYDVPDRGGQREDKALPEKSWPNRAAGTVPKKDLLKGAKIEIKPEAVPIYHDDDPYLNTPTSSLGDYFRAPDGRRGRRTGKGPAHPYYYVKSLSRDLLIIPTAEDLSGIEEFTPHARHRWIAWSTPGVGTSKPQRPLASRFLQIALPFGAVLRELEIRDERGAEVTRDYYDVVRNPRTGATFARFFDDQIEGFYSIAHYSNGGKPKTKEEPFLNSIAPSSLRDLATTISEVGQNSFSRRLNFGAKFAELTAFWPSYHAVVRWLRRSTTYAFEDPIQDPGRYAETNVEIFAKYLHGKKFTMQCTGSACALSLALNMLNRNSYYDTRPISAYDFGSGHYHRAVGVFSADGPVSLEDAQPVPLKMWFANGMGRVTDRTAAVIAFFSGWIARARSGMGPGKADIEILATIPPTPEDLDELSAKEAEAKRKASEVGREPDEGPNHLSFKGVPAGLADVRYGEPEVDIPMSMSDFARDARLRLATDLHGLHRTLHRNAALQKMAIDQPEGPVGVTFRFLSILVNGVASDDAPGAIHRKLVEKNLNMTGSTATFEDLWDNADNRLQRIASAMESKGASFVNVRDELERTGALAEYRRALWTARLLLSRHRQACAGLGVAME